MRPPRSWPALLLAGLVIPLSLAQAQTSPDPAASLESLAVPLYRELAAQKGIAAPGPPPPIAVRTRAETRRFIELELDRRYSPDRVQAERKGMVAWGLIPSDYDLRRLFVDLMQEQVAAYYDPRARVMVVADWLTSEQQQAALTHELVHALQDREISLDVFIAPDPGRGDEALARQALVEGEAVALTMELGLRPQGIDLRSAPDLGAARRLIAAGAAGPAITAAPPFLRDLLLFPYVDGLAFVARWRQGAPWSAMRDLYRDPPRSSAQILHPEKRIGAREDPVAIALPDLGSLGADVRVVAEDQMGEFALGSVLGLHLGDAGGRALAVGWRGDRYRVWEDGAGRYSIAYVLALESARAADAFASRYAAVLERRHPGLAGLARPAPAGALHTWQAGDRLSAVERRGAVVLVLEQIPAAEAGRVREAIWRSAPTSP